MKKLILIAALMAASTGALSLQALWTGQMEYAWTITGQQAYRCQYQTGNGTVWVLLRVMCPLTIEVE